MATTGNSLSGISSGIDTKALIDAILGMKGGSVTRLKAKKDLNDKKTEALTAMRTSLSAFSLSLAVVQDKLASRLITSSDSNNTNVTATGTGAAAGNYDITVRTVATKGRISATLDAQGWATNLAVASPTDSVSSNVFTPGTPAQFAIQGTDGVIKTITMTEGANTLNGLRDAINASGAGVTATVVNIGKGDKPYQLVLSAKETGIGTTQGVVTLVDITNMANGQPGAAANNLGITAGTVDSLVTPAALTGGLTSTVSGLSATNANFTLNGVELTRTTNVVKDAAEGMTFTLKQGGQTGTTTLSVTPDKIGATAAMQDLITKYNALVKDYKTASTSTKDSDGSIIQAPLTNDASTRNLMATLKSTLAGASAGLPGSATYKTMADLGVRTMADGTLFLNTNTLQTAMGNDLASVQRLFNFSGDSTNQGVAFKSAGPKTITGPVDFQITQDGGGTLWGAFTRNGVTSSPIQVAADGTLVGTGDYEGLNLKVTGTGSGTLTLSRGVGRAVTDLLSAFTGTSGGIDILLKSITTQNTNLGSQILQGQTRLDNERTVLTKKFAQMEAMLGRMKAASGSLSGL